MCCCCQASLLLLELPYKAKAVLFPENSNSAMEMNISIYAWEDDGNSPQSILHYVSNLLFQQDVANLGLHFVSLSDGFYDHIAPWNETNISQNEPIFEFLEDNEGKERETACPHDLRCLSLKLWDRVIWQTEAMSSQCKATVEHDKARVHKSISRECYDRYGATCTGGKSPIHLTAQRTLRLFTVTKLPCSFTLHASLTTHCNGMAVTKKLQIVTKNTLPTLRVAVFKLQNKNCNHPRTMSPFYFNQIVNINSRSGCYLRIRVLCMSAEICRFFCWKVGVRTTLHLPVSYDVCSLVQQAMISKFIPLLTEYSWKYLWYHANTEPLLRLPLLSSSKTGDPPQQWEIMICRHFTQFWATFIFRFVFARLFFFIQNFFFFFYSFAFLDISCHFSTFQTIQATKYALVTSWIGLPKIRLQGGRELGVLALQV